jgi:hypothetical protein
MPAGTWWFKAHPPPGQSWVFCSHLRIGISPLGNPAMPMKMPCGPQWFQDIEWNMPSLVMAGILLIRPI